MANLHELLKIMMDRKASDLHVTTGSPPQIRIDGELVPLDIPPLTPVETKQMCYSILTDAQKHKFEEENELDLSFGVKSLSRFRANIFMQRGAVAAAFRAIPFQIRTFQELGLPPIVNDLCKKPKGMVLVTGPTGSGKSTTLAAMIDKLNTETHGHIITVEDPIEFLHPHKGCVVNQREVGADTQSFKKALKYILRQDPDIVLIGELRDLETIEAALSVAETGHLVLSTLHTNNAAQTIDRIIDSFPAAQQSQIRIQLAGSLAGIFSQRLIPRISGGLIPAYELLINNNATQNLIREKRTHEINTVIETGSQDGMIDMNRSLADLARRGEITIENAYLHSLNPKVLEKLI